MLHKMRACQDVWEPHRQQRQKAEVAAYFFNSEEVLSQFLKSLSAIASASDTVHHLVSSSGHSFGN